MAATPQQVQLYPEAGPPERLELRLEIGDPELIQELWRQREGRERDEFARAALRIGTLALRQVRGQVDAQAVRGEVERMLDELRGSLAQHQNTLTERLGGALREYFDPESGRFAERVDRLTREDGELVTVIRGELAGDGSELARTLGTHLGPESPLMKLVDPQNAGGLLRSLAGLVDDALGAQREKILAEFSLDNREGSLTRLVAELRESHGKLGGDLGERIDEVVKEFSLDTEDSALSRLVQRVERAQQQITAEFSLDSDHSALARMRRELLELSKAQSERIASMEKTVASEMAALVTKRVEAERTTVHGEEFEDALATQLQRCAQRSGDIFERTGTRVGRVKNRKVGDAVLELGPEHRAAGARIVFEAKDERGFTVARAREQLELARKNRGAELGVFVFSNSAAPEGLASLERIGTDVLVRWDRDDPQSDVFLDAALSLCRALSARGASAAHEDADLEALDRAVREIERQSQGLDEIRKAALTVESGSERILNRVRIMSRGLAQSIEALDASSESLRRAHGADL